jgi:hypothetical protein
MDPVNPWLDPSEVRHLAEQLLRPVAPARLSAADPGFDASFIGFTSGGAVTVLPQPPEPAPVAELKAAPRAPSVPPLPQANQPVEQPAAAAPPSPASPPVSQPAPEPPPAAPSRTRFLERIHIFRDWLSKNFHATDIFILDREGKVIFDESGHGRLHFMARNLAIASRGSGNIHVKIGPSAILEVIPCETPYGRIVLGALLPDALPADHIHTITEVLIQTASPA